MSNKDKDLKYEILFLNFDCSCICEKFTFKFDLIYSANLELTGIDTFSVL